MINLVTTKVTLPDGREISIETGKLAKQADGSVVVRLGDTMLLATVVSNQDPIEGADFMPLTVEYREKYSAAGRFPGGFFKREAKPSDDEVLTMRLVDRALRPLFPDDYHADTQVIITLISADKVNKPDALACLAASAAIAISDIPFNGPVSEVRVARVNGEFVINPTYDQLKESDMDMVIAGSITEIVMVEGEMAEISEEEMVEAIKFAHEAIIAQCKAQLDMAAQIEKAKTKREYNHETHNEELKKKVYDFCYQKCYDVAFKQVANKHERSQGFKAVFEEFKEAFYAENEEAWEADKSLAKKYFYKTEKEAVRRMVLDERVRLDGRKLDEIRPIWSEVDYLPGTHGSAIFTRGETQSLTSVTLGSKLDEQMIDVALYPYQEKFLLHYNFPPFSTGEAKPMRGVSRREIGHGNLAHRALKGMLPKAPENPYTIRVVSDILESNGSSSMATVCAGTLALLDAGIKMKRPVSGIAMGLIADNTGKYAVLSDILGDEDHLGDMDFKVCGTEKGITACQMDMKVEGLSYEVLTEALHQAKAGRAHILNEMLKTMSEPRQDYKPHAPRIEQFEVPKESIGPIIGPGGKIIQEIQETTKTTIVIEEVNGKGMVQIMSDNKDNLEAALKRVRGIAFPPTVEVGEIYDCKVKTIMPYGAFLEVMPGTDGLLHISEIEHRKLDKVESVLKEGDIVKIKVLGKDPKTGKYKLSRKALLPREGSEE
ncbi:MAG: polyribonucleotide nucleotidyltransferase [Luteibaculaceae bacterium]